MLNMCISYVPPCSNQNASVLWKVKTLLLFHCVVGCFIPESPNVFFFYIIKRLLSNHTFKR